MRGTVVKLNENIPLWIHPTPLYIFYKTINKRVTLIPRAWGGKVNTISCGKYVCLHHLFQALHAVLLYPISFLTERIN